MEDALYIIIPRLHIHRVSSLVFRLELSLGLRYSMDQPWLLREHQSLEE